MNYFDTFALMIDCSRNGVMNLDSAKRLIVLEEKLGYNALMLYTEDTFEVEGEPKFGIGRGRYTIAEIQELDAFAKKHHVELIPCIETLAHLNCIFRHFEYDPIHDIDDILMVGEERTYELLDHMFASLEKAFTSRRVNVGMDEAQHLGRGKYLNEHGYRDADEIFLEHIKKVAEIAKKHGFEIMFWGDMPYNYAKKEDGTFDLGKLRPFYEIGATPIYWDYYNTSKKHYDDRFALTKPIFPNIWFAGGIWTWDGFAPLTEAAKSVTFPALQSCIENGVKNVIITLWGDNGAECSPWSALSSIFYSSELAKGITDENRMRADFKETLGLDYDDFEAFGKPNILSGYPEKAEGDSPIIVNPSKYLFYNDPLYGIFDDIVSVEDDAIYERYAKEIKASGKRLGEYAYLADYLSSLCDFLAVKNSLGVKARDAYSRKDREALKSLLPVYDEASKRLLTFLDAFRTRWMTDNKPQGFEIQEQRIGGVYFRLQEAKRTVSEYLDGKTESIPELEEPILTYPELKKGGKKRSGNFNSYVMNASLSVM